MTAIAVRELPSLRYTTEIVTPSGKRYRWASDEPDPRNIPSGVSSSSTMPGGFEQYQASLPRMPGVDYADLERLSTITERSADDEIIGEFRLERAPRVSGTQMVISPAAVGLQAHLTDDQTASLIVMDRDLGRWRAPSRQRQLQWIAANWGLQNFQTRPDPTNGAPCLATEVRGSWTATSRPTVEPTYDAGAGNTIGAVRATWSHSSTINPANESWYWGAVLLDADDFSGEEDDSGNLLSPTAGLLDVFATQRTRRYATLEHRYVAGPVDADNVVYEVQWADLRVIGDHGIPIYGATPAEEGCLASDVVAYVVRRFAPLLTATTGAGGTIDPSSFPIPQLAWPTQTNAGQMIRDCARFALEDWAVWENRTFYWHAPGARGSHWRARVAVAGLEETGPQIDRLWESVAVQYRDVDGSSRFVGPPGSGADVESALLKDTDPDNPANAVGITRRALLQAGTLTAAAAVEIGRRFLIEQKALDSSGRARLVGHVMDEHGVLHPYSHVRAGDTVTFSDAADTSARRIVRATHSHSERAVSIDLDAPPDALSALLERLGVVLAATGV